MHSESFLNKVLPLKEKVEDLEGQLRFVANCAHEAVDRIKELDTFVENIQAQLTSQTDNKLATLDSIKTAKHAEVVKLEEFQRKLNH